MDTTDPAPNKPCLLLVDDDPLIADTLGYVLAQDFQILTAESRSTAIDRVRQQASPPPLALVDLGLPPLPHRPDEGFSLITELLAHSPSMKILVLSGQSEQANGRHARALGATDFISKPVNPQQLAAQLREALAFAAAEETKPAQVTSTHQCRLMGDSLPIQKLRTQTRLYADSPFPVLIEGESGSGKEIIARCCLHDASDRKGKPYLALNCAAISPSLVEPTLFGYVRGAFTGANSNKSGYFEDADDGTLFLDEIGELPLELQAKLLRVLENGEYQRVGETQTRLSRARVIAATNRDLRREVREGRFRADLYHRLSVFTLSVPPLRDMGRDRLLLLEHFRNLYASQTGLPPFRLSPQATEKWIEYHFPGNVRELRNISIRLTAKYADQEISADELESEFDSDAQPEEKQEIPAQPHPTHSGKNSLIEIASAELQNTTSFSLDDTLRHWEKAYIEAAQHITGGNMSQTAKLLGLNRTTLYNRLEALARIRKNTDG